MNRISRKKIFGFLIACVVFQISITLFIFMDANQSGGLMTEAPTADLGFSKFVAAMVMHIQMNNEIFNGLKMIKYSVNHPWKFKNKQIAFLAGFLQVVVMLAITLINYFVIAISGTVIDVAKDFTALLIIADFDDFFGDNIEDELSKQVC